MGADGQPQIHLQVYTAMIDFGLDVQQAVEAPRWLAGRFALGEPRDLLNMEGRFPAAHGRRARAPRPRRSTAGRRGTSWPATRTASPSIPRSGALWAAPTRAATAPPSATDAPARVKRDRTGNLTILGSVANLIVVEEARAAGIEIRFVEYSRVGAPMTVLTLVIGWLVLIFVPV